MNREILFRGKRIDNDEWVYGFLRCKNYIDVWTPHTWKEEDGSTGEYATVESYQVKPETVGQYIGLTDKNGKKIFESDIVRDCDGRIYEIKHFDFEWIAEQPREFWINIKHLGPCEIIGNVFDYKLEDFR